MSEQSTIKPPIWFWIISAIALIWNAMGINAYLQQAYNTESYQAMYTAEQQEIVANLPSWVTAVFAIAVFSGTIAAIGLLLRKKWSKSLWLISLIGVIIQMGYLLIYGLESNLIMTIMIIVFALFFVWFSRLAVSKAWLS